MIIAAQHAQETQKWQRGKRSGRWGSASEIFFDAAVLYFASMVAALSPSFRAPSVESPLERRFLLRDVPWHVYVSLGDALEKGGAQVRMTYDRGVLELMSPSETHEDYKTMLGRLLEAYAEERDIDLNGRGSTTFREEDQQRGLEPDECYSIGAFSGRPDLAIEVAISNPLVDKLSVYAGLGIPEVWVWQKDHLVVHVLREGAYLVATASALLPALDLALLQRFVTIGGNQTQQVKAYRAALR
jgi:Uma2 family endonuclease